MRRSSDSDAHIVKCCGGVGSNRTAIMSSSISSSISTCEIGAGAGVLLGETVRLKWSKRGKAKGWVREGRRRAEQGGAGRSRAEQGRAGRRRAEKGQGRWTAGSGRYRKGFLWVGGAGRGGEGQGRRGQGGGGQRAAGVTTKAPSVDPSMSKQIPSGSDSEDEDSSREAPHDLVSLLPSASETSHAGEAAMLPADGGCGWLGDDARGGDCCGCCGWPCDCIWDWSW